MIFDKAQVRTVGYVSVVTVVYVWLVLTAASDVRGSDQYWYVADVQRLLQGGTHTTNNIYPAQIMQPGPLRRPPFVHDILNLYLIVPAAKIFGSYGGWIATNILATIVTGLMLALLVWKVGRRWIGLASYAVYLLLPLTIWQSSQPLAEATVAPFVAAGVLCYVWAKDKPGLWILTAFFAAMAYYCRASFSPILFIIPIAYFLENRPARRKAILGAVGLLCFAVFVVAAKRFIFEQSTPTSLRALINIGIPGVTDNMHSLYGISSMPIFPQKLWLKFVMNLYHQFFPRQGSYQIFYLPFNVLAGLSVYLLFREKSFRPRRLAYCCAALLAIHVATIMIVQDQFRYMLVVMPGVLAAGVVALGKMKVFGSSKVRLIFLSALFVALTICDIPIAAKLRQEGLQERQLRTALKPMFDTAIAEDESVIIEAPEKFQLLGYVLRPRTVVFVDKGYSPEQYQTMLEKSGSKWLLCPVGSAIKDYLDGSAVLVLKDFPSPYQQYGLFRLQEYRL